MKESDGAKVQLIKKKKKKLQSSPAISDSRVNLTLTWRLQSGSLPALKSKALPKRTVKAGKKKQFPSKEAS